MNKNCKYCDVEGMCVLENRVCPSNKWYEGCTVPFDEDDYAPIKEVYNEVINKKVMPNSYDKFAVYFYDNEGEYVYCIECWCNTVNELLDLIEDEHTDYTYEVRKVMKK